MNTPDLDAAKINATALAELASVKGQLLQITQMLALNHQATNTRIDDMRRSLEVQLSTLDTRLKRVEDNERGTAIRTAGIGAFSGSLGGAIVAAAMKVMSHTP